MPRPKHGFLNREGVQGNRMKAAKPSFRQDAAIQRHGWRLARDASARFGLLRKSGACRPWTLDSSVLPERRRFGRLAKLHAIALASALVPC
jgi:hypothetical protein